MRSRSREQRHRARIREAWQGRLRARQPRADAVRAARADATTASARCSRSARTRAGGAFLVARVPSGRRPRARRRDRDGPRRASCSRRAHASPGSTRARRCSRRRGARFERPRPARRGVGAERSRSRTPRSTISRSRTSSATSTTPARRCASSPASSGRAARSRRSSSASRAGLWRPLWELYVGVGLPLAGRVGLARLARGRPLPRPVDPRLLRGMAARAPARALAARQASTTCAPAG